MARKRARRTVTSGRASQSGAHKKRFNVKVPHPESTGKPRPGTTSGSNLTARPGASNREKAFHAGSIYRSSRHPDIFGNPVEPVSKNKALEEAGISLSAARRAASGLFHQAPSGEWLFKSGDTYKRRVSILIPLRFQDGDSRSVIVYSYREASIASRYALAVRLFREHKAGAEVLQQFEGLEVAGHRLLTDPAAIRRMAAAGEIRLDVFESGKEIRGAA